MGSSTRVPGPAGLRSTDTLDAGPLRPLGHQPPGPTGSGATHPDVIDPDELEMRELGLDLIHMALDLAGIADPTPISDGASGLMALARGMWLDAVISGASMIPYIGDLAKAGKLPRYLSSLERAVRLAEKSAKAAEALLPGLVKVKELLDLLPTGANKVIDEMRETVTRFVSRRTAKVAVEELPDVSRQFHFRTFERNGNQYREASGRLGVPGLVKQHRSASAQRAVSKGTGDDAGHLIGNQFGAPGGGENLTLQNRIANQGLYGPGPHRGTFHQLESTWATKLKEGTGIEVHVRDVTREAEARPFMRKVEWTEIAPDGTRTQHELTFANTHTPLSREKQGIPSSVKSPQENNVINVDFVNKKKLP